MFNEEKQKRQPCYSNYDNEKKNNMDAAQTSRVAKEENNNMLVDNDAEKQGVRTAESQEAHVRVHNRRRKGLHYKEQRGEKEETHRRSTTAFYSNKLYCTIEATTDRTSILKIPQRVLNGRTFTSRSRTQLQ
eukprot:3918856-Amphidinium_carterae.1